MIKIHDRSARGKTNIGWLDSKHTFSFGSFMDPTRMGFHALRVINDDIVAPGSGFDTHPHQNMEIITYILEGALEHKDSMGTGSVIRPGEIQKMSAGSGVTHSEFNASPTKPVHLYQIWLLPNKNNIQPTYEQIRLDPNRFRDGFVITGDQNASDSVISIVQDARMLLAMPLENKAFTHALDSKRAYFLQVACGQVTVEGQTLYEGDGMQIEDQKNLPIQAVTDAQLILFDMARLDGA